MMNGFYILGVTYCAHGIITGTVTYGTLTAIMQLIAQIQSPFANISVYIPRYYAMTASAERLMYAEKFAGESEKIDINTIIDFYNNEFVSLKLKNVSFTYNSNDNCIDGKKFVYKMRKLIMLPFILLVITISLLSKQIIRITFGNEFIIYYYWCIPLLLWLLVAINNNFLGHQILIGGGFDKSYSKCFQITICASMLINFTLIYFFRGDGASLSPLLSELLLTFLELREINKIERKECVK